MMDDKDVNHEKSHSTNDTEGVFDDDLFQSACDKLGKSYNGNLSEDLSNCKIDTNPQVSAVTGFPDSKVPLFSESQEADDEIPLNNEATIPQQLGTNSHIPGENRTSVEDLVEEEIGTADVNIGHINEVSLNNPPEVEEPLTKVEQQEVRDRFMEISVTEASKLGEGMSSYVTYKIETQTNIPLYRRSSFSVSRRFSDFLGLHEKLVEKYVRKGYIIPPAPEKNAIATTKVKMSSNQSEQASSSTDFVEKRRASLERYLKRTSAHPMLTVDPTFREFLEADGELPKATNTSALSGAGVKRLFSKVGSTVTKITYKMDENEPWFEEKSVLIESIDNQLRRLHNSVDVLVLTRKELAAATSAFAKSVAMLSNCEEHVGLSRALSQLADLEEEIETVHNERANSDFSVFCELIKDYISLFGAVKDVFHERVKAYQNWQHALMMLTKKRENKVKMEYTGRTDKLSSAITEVQEWEAKVDRCEEEFQKISKTIKLEYDRFEKNRIHEFRTILISYLESLVRHQEQVMKHWEAFLPEASAIV